MKRWWIFFFTWCALAVGCLHITVVAPPPETGLVNHEPGTPIAPINPSGPTSPSVHLASALATNPTEFFSNMRAAKLYYVTDPFFAGGAKGDNTTDDTAVFNAAIAKAVTDHARVEIPQPTAAYEITSELPVHGPVTIEGLSGTNVQETIVQMHGTPGAVRSAFELRTTFGALDTENGITRAKLANFTIDANRVANNCVIGNGAESSQLENVRLTGAIFGGYYEDLTQQAAGIGTVTCTGTCSPTLPTVTQPNPNYLNSPTQTSGTWKIKITTGGAVGTAQYQLSFDNGVTYQTPTQFVEPVSLPAGMGGGGDLSVPTGLRVAFSAGTYTLGDVYAIPITFTTGDFSLTIAANGNVIHWNPDLYLDGSIYASAGAVGPFAGYPYVQTVAGTVATTASSRIIVGTGTNWTSIVNAASGRIVLGANSTTFGNPAQLGLTTSTSGIATATVLDDTHISVGLDQEPIANASGLDYWILAGGGTYEDGAQDTTGDHYFFGNCTLSSICYQVSGRLGPHFDHPVLISSGVGFAFGQGNEPIVVDQPETDSGNKYDAVFAWDSIGKYANPTANIFSGAPLRWRFEFAYQDSPLVPLQGSTWAPKAVDNMVPSNQTISVASASPAIALPAMSALQFNNGSAAGLTSWINLQTAGFASMVLTGTPTIASPWGTAAGQYLHIFNGNFHSGGDITFLANFNTATGLTRLCLPGERATLQPEAEAIFVSTGHSFPQCEWTLVAINQTYLDSSHNGHGGDAMPQPISTTNATPTIIWSTNCANANVAPGTVLHWDISAQSNGGLGTNGVLVAGWRGTIAWDAGCTIVGWHVDEAFGNDTGGGPPNGWTITHDSGNPFASILVTGDATGHPVGWMAHIHYADPGQ